MFTIWSRPRQLVSETIGVQILNTAFGTPKHGVGNIIAWGVFLGLMLDNISVVRIVLLSLCTYVCMYVIKK